MSASRPARAVRVFGERIQLVSLDDGFLPDRTAENTQALIDRNALALLGAEAAGVIVRQVVPYFCAVTTSLALKKPSPGVALRAPDDAAQGRKVRAVSEAGG